MRPLARLSALLLLPVFSVACDKGSAPSDPSSAGGGVPLLQPTPKLFNVGADHIETRGLLAAGALQRVELPPAVTLTAEVPEEVEAVVFTIGDISTTDESAPFHYSHNQEGAVVDWELPDGQHSFAVQALIGGQPVGESSGTFSIKSDGTPSEAGGEHSRHDMWRTGSEAYVSRNESGDFVDAGGAVVLAGSDVELQYPVEGDAAQEQGHLVTITADAETLEFAFITMLPEGYDPQVKYPVVVFLHHGWDVYRGTDNDGRPLQTPLFTSAVSLTKSQNRERLPAIILVPQMVQAVETPGGAEETVTHEWAAFSDISNATGSYVSAPEVSQNAAHVMQLLEDVKAGSVQVGGQPLNIDPARIYVTGHSMGGLGTYDLLARFPEVFAAGVPMAGYSDHAKAEELAKTPIWAVHSELDCWNPHIGVETLLPLVNAVEGGYRMQLTALTEDKGPPCQENHFATPAEGWPTEGLIDWIFSQVSAAP